ADVLDHRVLKGEPEVLMDDCEPSRLQRGWVRRKGHLRPVDAHLSAAIGGLIAGQNLDQRRLARPILPNQTVDLTGVDSQRYIIEGLVGTERLRGVRDLEARYRCPNAVGR